MVSKDFMEIFCGVTCSLGRIERFDVLRNDPLCKIVYRNFWQLLYIALGCMA